MKRLRASLIAFALTATVLIAGCGGGSVEESTPSEATPTARGDAFTAALAELTIDDLAALVLQQGDYGLLAFGMEISDDSGPADNEKTADDYETIEVTAAELDRLGRLGGYILNFEPSTFEEGAIAQVGSWLELFDPSGDLDAYVELALEDIRATDGVGGFEVLELTEVATPGVEGAQGWRVVMRFPGIEAPASWSFGLVQRGRLLAGVQVAEFGNHDRTAEMAGVLRQLDRRLEEALSGTLEVTVEHVLPVTDDDREVPAPTGGPDLEAMALIADDLGSGWRIDDDGYYADPDRLAVFERSFKYVESGAAVLGTSEVTGVETELQLWPSIDSASSFVASRHALFEGPEGAANYARRVAEDGGPALTNPATSIEWLPLGDEALMLTITADWEALGPQALVFIWIRDGDVLSQTLVQATVTPQRQELIALAETAVSRVATARVAAVEN